jgi:hypothetical protein
MEAKAAQCTTKDGVADPGGKDDHRNARTTLIEDAFRFCCAAPDLSRSYDFVKSSLGLRNCRQFLVFCRNVVPIPNEPALERPGTR